MSDGRKLDHLRLCTATDPSDVLYPPDLTTMLECVELMPEGFPLVAPEHVDTSTTFLGKRVAAPIFVSAMTGGPARSGDINRSLARVCHKLNLPLALGSGRPMLTDASRADSFDVRDEAPDIPVLANIGLAQAAEVPVASLTKMVERIHADALVIHLNFAMEAIQPEGDRDPRPVAQTLARVREQLGHPVIVKEVGGGFTRGQLEIIASTGVEWIDVAGAGGTSWIRLEGRRGSSSEQTLAESFSRWGYPTAACLGWARQLEIPRVLASGGIRTGLDVARSLALGASLAGLALPLIRSLDTDGESGLTSTLEAVMSELRLAAHLCGVNKTSEMHDVPVLLTEPLGSWLDRRGLS